MRERNKRKLILGFESEKKRGVVCIRHDQAFQKKLELERRRSSTYVPAVINQIPFFLFFLLGGKGFSSCVGRFWMKYA